MFVRIFEQKFTSLDQAKIAANHLSIELGDKIETYNINSLSITIGKCASVSIVCKFENNEDMRKFELFANNLLKQMKQTFSFKSSGFPGVTIFNYESEAALEAHELN